MRNVELGRRRRAARPAGPGGRPHPLPWGSVAVALLALVALPTFVDVWLTRLFPGYLEGLHVVVTAVYALTSVLLVWEALAAWRCPAPAADFPPLPACTAVVAAYLPNEQEIILATLRHLLTHVDVPPQQFQVILAYNTPEPLAVEDEIRALAARDPRLLPLRVEGSRSKAENVNAALQAATGKIVAVYDADHLPAADCFRRAWASLSRGADMVQGRCRIKNHGQNALTRTVALEFDTIYAVAHTGRARLSGTAIFGGSNGYWRRETLTRLGMNPAMLTEDIDVSVRALLDGCTLVHDRDIVSDELAPLRLRDWLLQRKRWAQGWLEVSLKYTIPILHSPRFSTGQKLLWFYLLAWREIYPALSMQFFPLVLTSWLTKTPIHWFGTPFFFWAGLLNLTCGPFVLLATYACAPTHTRRGLGPWYWVYGAFTLVYTTLKLAVTLIAQVAHLLKDRAWVTTPRLTGGPPPS